MCIIGLYDLGIYSLPYKYNSKSGDLNFTRILIHGSNFVTPAGYWVH